MDEIVSGHEEKNVSRINGYKRKSLITKHKHGSRSLKDKWIQKSLAEGSVMNSKELKVLQSIIPKVSLGNARVNTRRYKSVESRGVNGNERVKVFRSIISEVR